MPSDEKITLRRVLNDHKAKIWAVAVHNTLPILATASADRTTIVYDLNNYQIITKLSETHKKSIRSVSWKPTGEFPCLAAGSFDSTMSIWAKTDEDYEAYSDEDMDDDDDSDAGVEEGSSTNKQWSLMAIIEGHENEIKCVSWSQDGNYLASCSRDKTIWIWEADDYNEEFECVNVLQDYHTQDVKFIKWGPDQYLVSASYDDTIKVFKDAADGDDLTCVCDLNAHDGTVWAIDFEPVSYIEKEAEQKAIAASTESTEEVASTSRRHWRFVSCSDDSSVKVWARQTAAADNSAQTTFTTEDTEDWQLEAKLPAVHKGTIYSVSWSANSGRIASVGSDGTIVVYKEIRNDDLSSQWQIELQKTLAHGVFEINSVSWVDNHNTKDVQSETLITSGDNGTVNVWKVDF